MDRIWEFSDIVDRLLIEFQVIAFFLMTTGFIIKVRKADFVPEALLAVIAMSLVILGLIVSQKWWFKETQGLFFAVAHQIKADYEANPFESIVALRKAKAAQERKEGLGHILNTVRAWSSELLLKAFMGLLMPLASGIQILYTCLYCVLIEVFRLLFPLALTCYMFDGLRSLGMQFTLKALSVMAWPVGFALIERIAQALQVHFYTASSALDRLHGGILFPLMLCVLVIGGTLKVPALMNTIFSGGDLAGSAGGFIVSHLSRMQGATQAAARMAAPFLGGMKAFTHASTAFSSGGSKGMPPRMPPMGWGTSPSSSAAPFSAGGTSSFTQLANSLASPPRPVGPHNPLYLA